MSSIQRGRANQGNKVCIAPRPVVRIVAIRRPTQAAGIDGAPG